MNDTGEKNYTGGGGGGWGKKVNLKRNNNIYVSVTGAHQLEVNPASWVTDRL